MSRRIHVDSSPSDDLRSNDYEDLNLFKCSEILEFQTEKLIPPDDHCTAYSLPFCVCSSPADSECESSHLLSHDCHCTSSSFSSSPSRIQAIEDGKKALMKLIENMPESSYELSLRDIVDDHQQILEEQTRNEMLIPHEVHHTAYSLPFLMCSSPADSEYEMSHLLSQNYHCTSSSFSSSPSHVLAIEDGKRALMKLIQNMPESSYELSLRDIIDDQQQIVKEQTRNEMILEGNAIPKTRVNLPRTNKNTRTRVQSSPRRIESMNSRVFLLKMFIPVSIGFIKKLKKRNGSRISSRPLFNGRGKPISTGRCKNKMAYSDKGEKKKHRSIVREGTISNKNSKNR